uniref:Uncharacterized protein n=1 Tax=Parascaris equorum TaxID=6256 RepID=A0A914S4S2_PAREQ
MPTSLDNIVAVVASNSLLAHDWSCFLHIYSRVAVVFCRGFRGSLMCVIGAMEREPSPEGTSMSNISLKAIENCLQQCVPIDEHLKNVQLACRTKRKSKESDCGTDSSSRKRTSGRLAKPARKKQPATAVASTSPAVAADEPTYCLCEQVCG